MPIRPPSFLDCAAIAFAAIATSFVCFVSPCEPSAVEPVAKQTAPALEGLIDASAAQAAGSEMLDDARVEVSLSFAPEHDRLVWRVRGDDRSVLLDAATGEAIGFEFEAS